MSTRIFECSCFFLSVLCSARILLRCFWSSQSVCNTYVLIWHTSKAKSASTIFGYSIFLIPYIFNDLIFRFFLHFSFLMFKIQFIERFLVSLFIMSSVAMDAVAFCLLILSFYYRCAFCINIGRWMEPHRQLLIRHRFII